MAASKYIRPMNVFQVIGSSFMLYIKNFLPFLGISLIIFIPSYILWGVFVGPMTIAASNAALGRPVKFGESFRLGMSKKVLVSLAAILIPICVLLSCILTIGIFNYDYFEISMLGFLGVYVLSMPLFVFFPTIVVLEKLSVFPALKRTFKLFFATFFRIIFLLIFIGVTFGVLTYLVANIQTFLGLLVLALWNPIMTLLYVLTYYEYRARKENYSEDVLSQELGFAPLEEMMM